MTPKNTMEGEDVYQEAMRLLKKKNTFRSPVNGTWGRKKD